MSIKYVLCMSMLIQMLWCVWSFRTWQSRIRAQILLLRWVVYILLMWATKFGKKWLFSNTLPLPLKLSSSMVMNGQIIKQLRERTNFHALQGIKVMPFCALIIWLIYCRGTFWNFQYFKVFRLLNTIHNFVVCLFYWDKNKKLSLELS